ncbi:DUF456 domain-containing protein [Halomicroarcula sp. GCM10025709]|uniref:DUF456 domain-containing protein n=1 Tax=Haloarcula TaxID=2237 RepID=UPI0024C28236|nr:DUF456 domain-containing protein [Halomicroarcula sp. YJ-61-S]
MNLPLPLPVLGFETTLVVIAFVLLIAGVVGSLVPQVPGAPLSLAGVYVYWVGSGMTEPGVVLLAVLTMVGALTWVVDFAGGAVAARVGGASTKTAVAAGLVGLVLFFVTGPLGILLGVALTVFALELYRQEDARKGLKAALVTTAGMLASGIVQAMLTGSMLVAMLAVALL